MENLIVCTLLYLLVVAFAFPKKAKPTEVTQDSPVQTRKPFKSRRRQVDPPVIDISCIFDEKSLSSAPVNTELDELQELTVVKLRELAKKQNIGKVHQLRKAELLEALTTS